MQVSFSGTQIAINIYSYNYIDFKAWKYDYQEMIAEEDPDGDGIVTKEEFTKMLERKKWSRPPSPALMLYDSIFDYSINSWTNKCLIT